MRRHLATALAATAVLGACEDSSEPGTKKPDPCPETKGTICTFIGTGHAGFDGDHLPLYESRLYWPIDMSFTSTGAYVLDWNNHKVRKILDDQTLETVIGTDFVGDGDPVQGDLVKPGVDALTIDLNHPTELLEMPDHKLLLVSWHNHKLRVWDPATGKAYVMVGRGAGYKGDGEGITGADNVLLNQPAAVRYDKNGNLYIIDQRNERIRRIKADLSLVETVLGTGEKGFGGDGGDPLLAKVSFPKSSNPPPSGSLDFDADGRLYFADTENNRIRRIDFEANTVDTVLGDGTPAKLANPRDVERGPDGRIYVADMNNHRVLALDPTSLEVEVIAGTGTAGFSGDYGAANLAQLNQPTGIAFDEHGDLYIADMQNNRIRLVRMGAE